VARAAKELESVGVSIDGIDLRCIDYYSIDYDAIARSLKKTGRLIIVEESPKSLGIGARIADEVQERYFRYLKGPVHHIGSIDVPLPVSKKLENHILINEEKVCEGIRRYVKEST
jgi:pyruvate/2-oxoglutarate/acetoin dehydrogenase E1 component